MLFGAIITPMKRTAYLPWILFAVAVGGLVYVGVNLLGVGLVTRNASALGAIGASFTLGLRFVRLRTPTGEQARRSADLTDASKAVSLLFLSLFVMAAVALAAHQIVQGYPLLDPKQVIMADGVLDLDFHTAQGKPIENAMYEMQGSEGKHFLVALEGYEGRILVMLDQKPSTEKAIRVTGKLRTDVRTVQRADDGAVEGPFLRLYRQHMSVPENTQIYFLDTGIRAGLNLSGVLLILVPFYLFLLVQGLPTRRRGLAMRPRRR